MFLGLDYYLIQIWCSKVKTSWDESLTLKYISPLTHPYAKKIESLAVEVVDPDKREAISCTINKYFQLFAPEAFPDKTWEKSKTISYIIIKLLEELKVEITDPRLVMSIPDAKRLVIEQYARTTLAKVSEAETAVSDDKLSEDFDDKYDEIQGDDDSLLMLNEIDFDIKKFSKVCTLGVGMSTALAGVAGIVAGIHLSNPSLIETCLPVILTGVGIIHNPDKAFELSRMLKKAKDGKRSRK